MRVNPQMTVLCRANTCLSIIVLDSHRNFIDVLKLCWYSQTLDNELRPSDEHNLECGAVCAYAPLWLLVAIQSSQSGAYAQTAPHSKKSHAGFLVDQHHFRTPLECAWTRLSMRPW